MKKIDRRQIGIKWKMFAILIMFVGLIGLTIWIFQIQMLNYFYQSAKFEELDDISNTIITNIDDTLTSQEVDIFISDLLSNGIINEKEAKLLKVATSDNILIIPTQYRDNLRANIFKNMLLNLEEN